MLCSSVCCGKIINFGLALHIRTITPPHCWLTPQHSISLLTFMELWCRHHHHLIIRYWIEVIDSIHHINVHMKIISIIAFNSVTNQQSLKNFQTQNKILFVNVHLWPGGLRVLITTACFLPTRWMSLDKMVMISCALMQLANNSYWDIRNGSDSALWLYMQSRRVKGSLFVKSCFMWKCWFGRRDYSALKLWRNSCRGGTVTGHILPHCVIAKSGNMSKHLPVEKAKQERKWGRQNRNWGRKRKRRRKLRNKRKAWMLRVMIWLEYQERSWGYFAKKKKFETLSGDVHIHG